MPRASQKAGQNLSACGSEAAAIHRRALEMVCHRVFQDRLEGLESGGL